MTKGKTKKIERKKLINTIKKSGAIQMTKEFHQLTLKKNKDTPLHISLKDGRHFIYIIIGNSTRANESKSILFQNLTQSKIVKIHESQIIFFSISKKSELLKLFNYL